MDFLKKLPVKYLGELHDVRLINFSVEREEVLPFLPEKLKLRIINNCALISMVDVKLRNMHPSFLPSGISFNYRHVAFRLLVDDSHYNNGECKGIYFMRSFTDKGLIVTGGDLFTEYKLEKASIKERGNMVEIISGGLTVNYSIGDFIQKPSESVLKLKSTVGAIDRAYSFLDNSIRCTKIQREKWPIVPVECWEFSTTFFKTARLEGAFRVPEVIYYQWLPSEILQEN